jgi:L-ribulose-5-phosphate 3-epimerase
MKNILAASTNTYHTHTMEEALAGIAKAGFKNLELGAVRGWTEHLSLDATDQEVAHFKDLLKHYDLALPSVAGHTDLTTREGLADGIKALNLCQKLGVHLMITSVGGHASKEENKAAFMKQIFELSDRAADHDITIALEIHGDIMASGALSLPLLQEIGRDNVKVNYDTANCVFYGGVEAVDDIQTILPYLAYVHLKDTAGSKGVWNFPAIGEGHVDFARLFKILDNAGYQGPYCVEIEFQGAPFPPVAEVDRAAKTSYEALTKLGLH